MISRFYVHFHALVCTYVHGVEKPTTKVVDLSQFYSDLQAGRKRSTKMDLTLPNLCSNSNSKREHDIKEYHPTNYHREYELLQKKDESYKMELSKRTNTKWNKIKEINF